MVEAKPAGGEFGEVVGGGEALGEFGMGGGVGGGLDEGLSGEDGAFAVADLLVEVVVAEGEDFGGNGEGGG